MKLEQQVVSLKLAKRLKELGVKQDAFLVWDADETKICRRELYEHHNHYSAFSVAELGEMLPTLQLKMIHRSPIGDYWTLPIHADAHPSSRGTDHVETEADARGKMLIYLLENNLLR